MMVLEAQDIFPYFSPSSLLSFSFFFLQLRMALGFCVRSVGRFGEANERKRQDQGKPRNCKKWKLMMEMELTYTGDPGGSVEVN